MGSGNHWHPALPRPQGVRTQWYFVAATFDAASRTLSLYQQPTDGYANDPTGGDSSNSRYRSPARPRPEVPLLMAAYWAEDGAVGGYYSGKIDNPKLYDRALTAAEIDAIGQGEAPSDAVAAWDFAADLSTDRVCATRPLASSTAER